MSQSKDIKGKIIRGGVSMTLRQLLVAALSMVNVLVIARMLGPGLYGVVTIVLSIFYFLNQVCRFGLQVYLVRQPNLTDEEPIQIQAFYNFLGIVICAVLFCIAPLIGWWTKEQEVTYALQAILPALWMDMVSRVPTSMLERELSFDKVGLLEAVSKVVLYVSAIPLVLIGWGYWGPIIGTVLGYLVQLIMAYYYYPVPWRWRWQWKVVKPAVNYGLTYSGSDAILNLRRLRLPLLVSRLGGTEVVGYISIAMRLAEQLAILRLVVRRMSISVMAKLVDKPEQTRNAISKGMTYQALLIGPICAAFSCTSAWLIPLMFSKEWLISAQIFPFIAVGVLVGAIFELHTSSLYAVGRNYEIAQRNAWYVGILWLATIIFLPWMGLWGYGLSEILALPTFYLLHTSIVRLFGSPNYWDSFWITLVSTICMFAGVFLPPIAAIGLLVVSYGAIFIYCPGIRKIPVDLWAARKKAA
ncbi:oligosaccharide flippase family protein [Calothrix sp. FACHB-1219]|uniref:oligosaccharide flippase family protein n=1 Tax=unclassified Calothrix TaxID=2619626 RepID=UPI0016896AE2|nr:MULTISPECIES: oligosaccharide flippase family protein [unclassified Calothrix]MBD2206818.1 oligosaccharide flippase family protein [Calothrix sp. FACHB-168]MBD2219489.1 oligosaccharide flippase family protein [Calothrix sp. FACHB-1219]